MMIFIVRFVLLCFSIVPFVRIGDGRVSCASCSAITLNITTDFDIPTSSCSIKDEEVCQLTLRLDYTNNEKNFVLIDGINETLLLLTNGEPQISETTSIWFNEIRVQRMASIVCFYGSSCGLDRLKQIYRQDYRTFQYETIQRKLADLLYSSTTVSTSLTCSNVDDQSVPCPNGFCRSIFDGNGLISYSTCMTKGNVEISYGLIVSKMSIANFSADSASVIYTCNKPQCNSRNSTKQVHQMLIDAKLLPTTTSPTNNARQSFSSLVFIIFIFIFLF